MENNNHKNREGKRYRDTVLKGVVLDLIRGGKLYHKYRIKLYHYQSEPQFGNGTILIDIVSYHIILA